MLVLSRCVDESLVFEVGETRFLIKVSSVDRERVRLAIHAPGEVRVLRDELLTREQLREVIAGASSH